MCCTLYQVSINQTLTENNNQDATALQAYYKNLYGFTEPSEKTRKVFDEIMAQSPIQIPLLEYPSNENENHTRSLGPSQLRVIVMPNLSTLEKEHLDYEIFALYRELNKIINWNGISLVGGVLGFFGSLLTLPIIINAFPHIRHDIKHAYDLAQLHIISPRALWRIASPLLLIGAYILSVTVSSAIYLQLLFMQPIETGLDINACKQLIADGKTDILENAITYLKNHKPHEKERIRKLQFCKDNVTLPMWQWKKGMMMNHSDAL